jgi:hypothetical protein
MSGFDKLSSVLAGLMIACSGIALSATQVFAMSSWDIFWFVRWYLTGPEVVDIVRTVLHAVT